MEINELINQAHNTAKLKGFYSNNRNIGELLMLVVSELSEALEAHRKGKHTNKFGYSIYQDIMDFGGNQVLLDFEEFFKDTFEDEIADTFIRLADLCGYLNIDIEKHIKIKMKYNSFREIKHGKKY